MTKNPVDATSTDFASITSNYQYKTSGNTTTNLISCLNNTITGEETNTVNYSYTYDSNGKITNISTVSSVPNLSGASQYIYDGAGQLVREVAGSTTYEYAYDLKGNISSRKTYSNDTLTKTDTFTYGATDWEDRLTGYGNKTVVYDETGNPTSYLGATLTWRGRELAGYSKGNKQISYSYDVDGMRYQKIVTTDGVETARCDYVYSDGKLILLTYTANGVSNTARFIYDSWGEPRGFILNNTAAYIYLKNAQGDITAIADENGEVLLTYTYTAWGKVTYSATSMQSMLLAATLSNVNPFTYRGYCYDYDIGMYYLQSRYYDPEICRFINADSTDYLGATGTLLSYNLFAYCENEPVDFVDTTGTWGEDVHRGYYDIKDSHKKDVSVGMVTNKKYIYNAARFIRIPYVLDNKKKKKYYGTYYWAIQCGIKAKYAKIIADACNNVDNLFKGISWAPYIGDQSWHFNTNYGKSKKDSRKNHSNDYIKKAEIDFKNGDIAKGLKNLGMALHPLQDMSAHTEDVCIYENIRLTYTISGGPPVTVYVKFWRHPKKVNGIKVDSAKERKKKLLECKDSTKEVLEGFVKKYPELKR